MKNIMFLAGTLWALLSHGQTFNLVPNPGFENYVQCPNSADEFDGFCSNWFKENFAGNSPDYFNCGYGGYLNGASCTEILTIGSSAYKGSACAGIITHVGQDIYNGVCGPANDKSHNEFIQVKLTRPLIANEKVDAYIYIKRDHESGAETKGIGLNFTPTADVSGTTPDILINGGGNGWKKAGGTFTAAGGEEYLTIGATVQSTSSPSGHDAYYYIDEVRVGTECCPEYKVYQNISTSLPDVTQVANYITAGRNVGVPQVSVGDVVVKSGKNITFKAGREIKLTNGFYTETGGSFHAYAAPCDPELWDPDLPSEDVEIFNGFQACCPDEFLVKMPNADHYKFTLYNNQGSLAFQRSGDVWTPVMGVWNGEAFGNCVSMYGVYVYELELWGCEAYSGPYTGTITVLPCPGKKEDDSEMEAVTGVEDAPLAEHVALVPNPFSDRAQVSVSVPEETKVSIRVYDNIGNAVMVVSQGQNLSAGTHNFEIGGAGLPAGIYNVVIGTGDKTTVKKLVKM